MAGDKKGEDMRTDEGAYDTQEVESKVGDALAALTGRNMSPDPQEDTEDVQDQSTEEPPTPEHQEPEAGKSVEPEPEPKEKEDTAEADEPAIPDNVYQSLLHNGWKPDQISSFQKADPKLAKQVFEQVHRSVNDLSKQFASIGRSRIELAKREAAQKAQPKSQPEASSAKPVIDIEALRQRDPDNELLPIVEGLNKALTQLTQQSVQQVQEPESQNRTQEDIALASQILTFLGGDAMKGFGEFYGPAFDANQMPIFDGSGLTPGQKANRDALIEKADEIWVGAKMHGRELSVPEALSMAHALLTEPFRTQQVRNDLISKVKARSKGMTLRSSNAKLPEPKAGNEVKPKTEAEFEARTAERLAKLRHQR